MNELIRINQKDINGNALTRCATSPAVQGGEG